MNAYQDAVQTSGSSWTAANHISVRAYRRHQAIPMLLAREAPLEMQQLEVYGKQLEEVFNMHQEQLAELRKTFVFENASAVASFMRDHRTAPQILLEAIPQLRKHFGSTTVFMLRTRIEEDGYRELHVLAKWPGNARAAMNALDSFNKDWWISNFQASGRQFHFTYELE